MENKDLGYICLFRSIKKNWIWNDPIKLKWWIDLLLSVNFSKEIQKINIGYDIFECGRGQTIKSLQSWSTDWKVGKDTVRNFLELLKKDTMITTENFKKTTRITICNFDDYQTNLHDKQTQSKRKANAIQTQGDPNNNDNNEKKDKKDNKNYITRENFILRLQDVFNGEETKIALLDFFDMRLAKKAQMTERAVELLFKQLKGWQEDGFSSKNIISWINNSTINNYTGIFKPKN